MRQADAGNIGAGAARGSRAVFAALLAAALCACATPPSAPPAALPAPAEAEQRLAEAIAQGAAIYRVDAAASQLLIHVYRGGRAARLGHNHVLDAPDLAGWASLRGDEAGTAAFDLTLRLDALRIDAPALREAIGDAFAGARSETDIAGTRRNLLASLDAARHPEVRVSSLSVAGDWPLLVARIAVTLHGVTRAQDLPIEVRRSGDTLTASGAFALRQSDFGITPYSVFGGALAVQDVLAVRFALTLRREAPGGSPARTP